MLTARLLRLTILAVVLLALNLALGANPAGAEPTRMTDNSAYDVLPQLLDDGRLLWQGWDGHDYEIYCQAPGQGVTQLTNNDSPDVRPQMNALGQLTWMSWDGNDWEVWYNLGDGPVQLTDNTAAYDVQPLITADAQIYWQGWDGQDYEIYRYNSDSQVTTKLTDNTLNDVSPQVNASGQLTWMEWDGKKWQVFYDLGDGPVQLTHTTNGSNLSPQITDNGQIYWQGWDGQDYEIYCYSPWNGVTEQLTDNTVADTNPAVKNGALVWSQWDGHDNEIYFSEFGETKRLTDNEENDLNPRINNLRQIVWQQWDGSDYEIYTDKVTYALKPGPYEVVDLGVPFKSAGTVPGKVMFETSEGDLHMILGISGGEDFYLIDINVTDNMTYVVSPPEGYQCGLPLSAFAVLGDKLYFSPNRYLFEYDLSGRISVKGDLGSGQVGVGAYIGKNDKLYIDTYNGKGSKLFEYDPSTEKLVDMGVIAASATETYGGYVGVDGDYAYCAVRQTNPAKYYLCVVDLSDKSKTWYWVDANDAGGTVGPTTDGGWQYNRILADGSRLSYGLTDGKPTVQSPKTTKPYRIDSQSRYKLALAGGGNDGEWRSAFNYDWLFDEMVPWDGQPYSKVYYRTPSGSGDYTLVQITFDTLPLSPVKPFRILPIEEETGELLVFGEGYTPMAKFNYVTGEITDYLGFSFASVYSPVSTSTGYYIGAYPNTLMRYDSSMPWTLTAANYNPNGFSPDDPNHTNPYSTGMRYGKWNYYTTYAYDNTIWTGMEYRDNPAGGIAWYNPLDGTSGEYRNELIPVSVRSLVAADNRTKICYGGNGNQIFVFDVATKTLERTINVDTGFAGNVILAEAAGNEVYCVVTNESTFSKLVKVDISTGAIEWIRDMPSGVPFGYAGGTYRHNRRFVWGPDGNMWLFIGNVLYRVDTNGNFTKVHDFGFFGMITFVNKDLVISNINNSNSLKVVYSFFE